MTSHNVRDKALDLIATLLRTVAAAQLGPCATHERTDLLEYDLYGFTEEEIVIVEGREH